MKDKLSSRMAREWVVYYTALATTVAVLLGSLLLAMAWITGAAAAETGPLTAELLLAEVQRDAESRLGVDVATETLRVLPLPALPPGRLELRARYPSRPGFFLPDAVECRVDGVLRAAVPLGQYVQFRLRVLVAPDGLALRQAIGPADLASEEQVLRPGSEVTTAPEQALGQMTRGSFARGARIVLSRLMRPYDVMRGGEVLLQVSLNGVRMQARATALADAYIGQRVTVERADDKCKYTGLLCAGPMVVVQ